MNAVALSIPAPSLIRRAFAVATLVAAVLVGNAALHPVSAGKIWFEGGLFGSAAVRGYDVVAYFTQAKPVEGKRSFSHKWNDAEWRFASAGNRDLFAANPEKYAPQYGGWCAWAVSQGYTASIDPQAWRIVDGKLYLNYSKSVQTQWVQDVPGNITRGDRNWPGIKQNLAAK
jgi:hypothetical protein